MATFTLPGSVTFLLVTISANTGAASGTAGNIGGVAAAAFVPTVTAVGDSAGVAFGAPGVIKVPTAIPVDNAAPAVSGVFALGGKTSTASIAVPVAQFRVQVQHWLLRLAWMLVLALLAQPASLATFAAIPERPRSTALGGAVVGGATRAGGAKVVSVPHVVRLPLVPSCRPPVRS